MTDQKTSSSSTFSNEISLEMGGGSATNGDPAAEAFMEGIFRPIADILRYGTQPVASTISPVTQYIAQEVGPFFNGAGTWAYQEMQPVRDATAPYFSSGATMELSIPENFNLVVDDIKITLPASGNLSLKFGYNEGVSYSYSYKISDSILADLVGSTQGVGSDVLLSRQGPGQTGEYYVRPDSENPIVSSHSLTMGKGKVSDNPFSVDATVTEHKDGSVDTGIKIGPFKLFGSFQDVSFPQAHNSQLNPAPNYEGISLSFSPPSNDFSLGVTPETLFADAFGSPSEDSLDYTPDLLFGSYFDGDNQWFDDFQESIFEDAMAPDADSDVSGFDLFGGSSATGIDFGSNPFHFSIDDPSAGLDGSDNDGYVGSESYSSAPIDELSDPTVGFHFSIEDDGGRSVPYTNPGEVQIQPLGPLSPELNVIPQDDPLPPSSHASTGPYEVGGVIINPGGPPVEVGGVIYNAIHPIVLDLTGNGINITDENKSNQFYDMSGDGYQQRTAWAGVGNGVLVLDINGDGKITQRNQVVFTDWDPTATSDMQALEDVFDTNHDGKLDADDTLFSSFKVMVTNADGTTTLKTLSELGIQSIDLTPNVTRITLPDGSVIEGETTYTKTDGSTNTVATVSFAVDENGYVVQQTVTHNTDGSTVLDNKALNGDGSVASDTVTTTNADGSSTTTFDLNGDGVVDKILTDGTVTNTTDNSRTETQTEVDGGGVLIDQTVTVTSADGRTISIYRDGLGGGFDTQDEVRTTNLDGSASDVISDLNPNGSVRDSSTSNTTSDGLTRTVATDSDGDGIADLVSTDKTSVNADHSRMETVSDQAANGALIDQTVTVTSASGQSKTITQDVNGDGVIDVTRTSTVTTSTDNNVIDQTDTNADGSLRDEIVTTISTNGLSTTTQTDSDGINGFDTTTVDATVINSDQSRTETVTVTSDAGSLSSKVVTLRGADGQSRNVQTDSNGDGHLDQTETIAATSGGSSIDTLSDLNADGSLRDKTVTTTSADGLSVTTDTYLSNASIADRTTTDIISVVAGVSTETITDKSSTGAEVDEREVVTSADGLTVTTSSDIDGNGTFDQTTIDQRIPDSAGDGGQTETVTIESGNGTLLSKSTTTTSADHRVVTTTRDNNGDGSTDQTESVILQLDGSTVDTLSNFNADGSLINQTIVTTSADNLSKTTAADTDGDGAMDVTTTDVTTLNADGSKTDIVMHLGGSTLVGSTTTTVSANGLSTTTLSDVDGDGITDLVTTDITVLNADGSRTETVTGTNAEGTKVEQIVTTTAASALSKTISSDLNGDGTIDLITSDVTVLNADGSKVETVTSKNGDGSLRGEIVTETSADRYTVSIASDFTGDGNTDQEEIIATQSNGSVVDTVTRYNADRSIISQIVTSTAANGLSKSVKSDLDGNGTVDLTRTDVTTINGDGGKTETVTDTNADGSLRDKTFTTTSGDGLVTTVVKNIDGNANNVDNIKTVDSKTLNADGSTSESVIESGSDGTVLGKTVTVTSADSRLISISRDTFGDTNTDQTETIALQANGNKVDTVTNISPTGVRENQTVTTTSADALSKVVAFDKNGDNTVDSTLSDVTTLSADGSRTETIADIAGTSTVKDRTVITTSGSQLSKTTQLDFDGDGTFDRTTTDVTVENDDGSKTETQTDINGNLLVEDQVISTTSADGLSHVTSTDINGDGEVDRTTSDVIVLNADGGQTETVTDTSGAGTVLDQSVETTSASGQSVTTSRIVNGSLPIEQVETKTTEDNGTGSDTISTEDLSGTTLNSVTTATSANGLSIITSRDQNGDGVADITTDDEKTLNVDGSTQDIVTVTNATGDTIKKTWTSTAGNGLSKTVSVDENGDGSWDRITKDTIAINASGARTETVIDSSANGTQLDETTTVTSKGAVETQVTRDFEQILAQTDKTTSESDGSTLEQIVSYKATNSNNAITSTVNLTTSANGLSKAKVTLTPSGATLDTQTDTITLNADGSTIETRQESGLVIADKVVKTTTANGLSSTIATTLTGYQTSAYNTSITTIDRADGSRTTTVVDTSAAGSDNAIISAAGLGEGLQLDENDDGFVDITASSLDETDGSTIEGITVRNAATHAETQKDIISVSADGRVASLQRDANGDGTSDYFETIELNVDGSVTDTTSASSYKGAAAYSQTKTAALNPDGSEGITTSHYSALGELLDTRTTTIAANGLSTTTAIDTNADGTADLIQSDVTTLSASGSTLETISATYASGSLKSKTNITTSADGHTITTSIDKDGNGISEQTSVLSIFADGSSSNALTFFDNTTGKSISTATVTVDSTGLQTVLTEGNNIDTTTRFADDNASYEWQRNTENLSNGRYNIAASVTHEIDANGIDTWSWTTSASQWVWASSVPLIEASGQIQIDTATEKEDLGIAAGIYGSIFGREMSDDEQQLLGQYIQNGSLNTTLLINNLMATTEFSTRYGTLSDNVAFVTEIYKNAFGHSLSFDAANQYLMPLINGTMTRAQVVLAIVQSAEDLGSGDGLASILAGENILRPEISSPNPGDQQNIANLGEDYEALVAQLEGTGGVLTSAQTAALQELLDASSPGANGQSANLQALINNGIATDGIYAEPTIPATVNTMSTATLSATSTTATFNNGYVTDISNIGATVTGNGNYIFQPGSSALTVVGTDNTIEVSGTGSVTAASSSFITVDAGSSETLIGSGDEIYLDSSSTLKVTGSNDAVAATGTGSQITQNNGTITFELGASATVTGSADTLIGAGNNIYKLGFSSGFGQTIIINGTSTTQAPSGQLSFVDGIVPAMLDFGRTGDDLTIQVAGTNDGVTIKGWFSQSYSQLNSIAFADGTVISTAAITALSQEEDGSASLGGLNRSIQGTASGDDLANSAGSQVFYGGAGNDTYHLDLGDGHDDIIDHDASATAVDSTTTRPIQSSYSYYNATTSGGTTLVTKQITFNVPTNSLTTDDVTVHDGGTDTLAVGAGISASDLVFEFRGNDLYVGIADPSEPGVSAASLPDAVRLANWLTATDRVENIKFNDGTVAAISSLVANIPTAPLYLTVSGTAGNDILSGTASADDLLEGGAENDTYVFGRGSGWDAVLDQVEQAVTTTTTQPYSATYQEPVDNYQVIVSYTKHSTTTGGGQGDPGVTTTTYTPNYAYQSQVVTVVDNTPQTVTTTYWQTSSAGQDTLQFGAGVSVEDVAVLVDGKDLIVALRDPSQPDADFWSLSDQMRIENWSDPNSRIETFSFADGTTIDVSTMVSAEAGDSTDDQIIGDASTNWLSGGAGNDVLRGFGGDDVIIGGDGNDLLIGGSGADLIYGGNGEDTADYSDSQSAVVVSLVAGAANMGGDAQGDVLSSIEDLRGSTYNDTLTGNTGDNRLDGDGGTDTLVGGGGQDTYVVDPGATTNTSQVTIVNGFSTDTTSSGELLFGAGVTANLLSFSQSGSDLVIHVLGLNDQVTVKGWFSNPQSQLSQIVFADGSQIGNADINAQLASENGNAVNAATYGYAVLGTVGSDVLANSAPSQVLIGGVGNDIYEFNLGDGHDEIIDQNSYWGQQSTKGPVSRTATGSYSYTSAGQVITKSVSETVTDYNLTITPMAAHDDAGIDTIKFGAGISAQDLVFEFRDNDLYIGIADPEHPGISASALPNSIRLADWLNPLDRVENVQFNDGSTASIASLVGTIPSVPDYSIINGTVGNDILVGTYRPDQISGEAGDDALSGGSGNDSDDLLEGGSGNDTYEFGYGSGWDAILDQAEQLVTTTASQSYTQTYSQSESYTYITVEGTGGGGQNGGSPTTTNVTHQATINVTLTDHGPRTVTTETWQEVDGGQDSLQFSAGITAANIMVMTDGNDLLVGLVDPDNPDASFWSLADQMRIENWVDANSRIETFSFADGTNINVSTMLAAYAGTNGSDQISGDSATNWLSGGAGNDVLSGLAGDDILSGGDGDDTLVGGAGADRLYGGNGSDTADYSASQAGVNVSLVAGAMNSGGDAQGDILSDIENITGSASNDILIGNAGNNTLLGNAGDDTLDGGGGTDTLMGGGGYDTYKFASGYGSTIISNSTTGGTTDSGELDLAAGITSQDLWLVQSEQDLVIDVLGSTDKVTVVGWFGANASAQLSEIKISDGSELDDSSVSQLVSAMAAYQSSNSSFNPTTVNAQMPADANVQSAIITAWRH